MKHTLYNEDVSSFLFTKIMRKFWILSFFVLISLNACQNKKPTHAAIVSALSYCEAFYDLDYVAAKELATAASFSYISFIATNTTQKHVNKVKARGPVTVSVVNAQINEEEGEATVVCTVKNSLKINFFDATSVIIPEKQDTLHLVKEGELWLVKMDNPLQSEMQNRD